MHVLNSVWAWEAFRFLLDRCFGHYRRRTAVLRSFGITPDSSVLDIGCGTGQYAASTTGRYLGVDLEERYLAVARRRHRRPGLEFRRQDVAALPATGERFDVALLVDLLHHLRDDQADVVIAASAQRARRLVVCEQILEQPTRWGRWLVAHDRGRHTRREAQLRELIGRHCTIAQAVPLKLMGVASRCLLALPRTSGGRPPTDPPPVG